ncbi:MAG: DUF3592 domain-containing protein [Fimbriimonadaceae bacterium]|nr:DUF3592 domain-containing protein [Fimbriimonadaceae bacterium]QYK58247.1 MAG: DUF3592 domain-containing protein [Fimbriimonadaceae bacterium]
MRKFKNLTALFGWCAFALGTVGILAGVYQCTLGSCFQQDTWETAQGRIAQARIAAEASPGTAREFSWRIQYVVMTDSRVLTVEDDRSFNGEAEATRWASNAVGSVRTVRIDPSQPGHGEFTSTSVLPRGLLALLLTSVGVALLLASTFRQFTKSHGATHVAPSGVNLARM